MGNAEDWQALFRENGWWGGETITAPAGYVLRIDFMGSNQIAMVDGAVQGMRSLGVVEGGDKFIVVRWKQGTVPMARYCLWESIISATLEDRN
jgi:hypothetical protein